jgi:excisionase family DNA binding protein
MLTVVEVAAHVRGDVDYVYKLIRCGTLPATQQTPRKTLIREADVWAFLHPHPMSTT